MRVLSHSATLRRSAAVYSADPFPVMSQRRVVTFAALATMQLAWWLLACYRLLRHCLIVALHRAATLEIIFALALSFACLSWQLCKQHSTALSVCNFLHGRTEMQTA